MNHQKEGRENPWSLNTKSAITVGLLLCLLFSAVPVKADWKSDANARIEANRKRNAQITVVDANSDPIPGVSVQIEQTKHRFGFGTCLTTGQVTNANHQNFIRNHFEWAVCENDMKWSSNEATRDVWTFSNADTIATWCANNDIKLRGHTLVWETGNQTPSWVPGLQCATYPTTSAMLEEVDERINYTVGRYAGQIVQWDINNEMLSGSMFNCLGEAGRAHMFNLANSVDPNCLMMMNEYAGNSFGGYDGWTYRDRANGLIALGAAVEGLGIQGHVATPFRPEDYYNDVLEPLAEVGLPIIVTEFSVNNEYDGSQIAIDLENFYRICFSHPLVEAIIMWGYHQDSWQWGGIVNSSTWTLNAGGVKYEDLMDEWTTNDSNTTNGSGNVYFRGFHGTYDITLSVPGEPNDEVSTIELVPGGGTAQFVIETDFGPIEPDANAPEPDPMTFFSVPTATGSSTITMTATTASDDTPPVLYYFECTNDAGKSSSWQTSTTYTAQGLTPLTQYTFRVRARDSYTTPNYTGWSDPASAITLPPPTNIEIIGSWATGLSHAEESGYSRALIFITHAEDDVAITLNSVTYGGQTMTPVVERVTGTSGYRAYVAAYILDDDGIDAATSGTIFPNWATTPENVSYASVFLGSVDQTTPVGATASNSTTNPTPNPITTSALATDDGDMVIDAAVCGNSGDYTLLNGFTEAPFEHDMGSSTGADGYKSATGANETPSAQHNSVNRQAIIGFVVQAAPAVDEPPAAPTGLAATPGNDTVSLDWSDNGEADMNGYNVYRSTTQGSGYGKLNVALVADSNYIDSDVNNGTPYYYVVTAVDINDHESVYSIEAPATPDYQTCQDVIDGGDRLVSDIDGDCYVDLFDVEIIAGYWLHTDCAGLDDCENADIEPQELDGDVDFFDFSDFAADWLNCNNPEDTNCP